MRSGTTLVARALRHHPLAKYPGFELSDVWAAAADVEISSPETDDAVCPAYGSDHATADRAERVQERFARVLWDAGGKAVGSRLILKNPHFWNKLPFLAAVLPGTALVVTRRDIRSSVASMKRLWHMTHERLGLSHHLPEAPETCWMSIPPAPAAGLSAERTFPGGDVAVLAEYWLRTYESIDACADLFGSVIGINPGELMADPRTVLPGLHRATGLPADDYVLPIEPKPDRDSHWEWLLTPDEQRSLDAFIEHHRDRVLALRLADTSL